MACAALAQGHEPNDSLLSATKSDHDRAKVPAAYACHEICTGPCKSAAPESANSCCEKQARVRANRPGSERVPRSLESGPSVLRTGVGIRLTFDHTKDSNPAKELSISLQCGQSVSQSYLSISCRTTEVLFTL